MLIRPFFDTAKEIRRGQFLEDATKTIIQKIVEETGVTVIYGTP